MTKHEKVVIGMAIEAICESGMNGDYPFMESSSTLKGLCDLFSINELLDAVDPRWHEVLRNHGGLTKREADAMKLRRSCKPLKSRK